MTIELRPFVATTAPDATFRDSQRLMAASFPDASATAPEFLRWLYLDNPFGRALGLLAYDGGEPVAQLFVTFQGMARDRQRHAVGVASNACTLPAYRRRGLFQQIFARLLDECRRRGVPFVWAFPNPASRGGFLKAGFRVAQRCALEVTPVSYLGALRDLARKERFAVLAGPAELDVALGDDPRFALVTAADVDALDPPPEAAGVWHVPLTPEQVRWRYLEHPTRRYRVLRHRATGGVAVLRFVRLFGLDAAVVMKTTPLEPGALDRVMADLKRLLADRVNLLTRLHPGTPLASLRSALRGRFVVPGALGPRPFPLAVHALDAAVTGDAPRFNLALGDYEAL